MIINITNSATIKQTKLPWKQQWWESIFVFKYNKRGIIAQATFPCFGNMYMLQLIWIIS